jgi:hypothetical protein
VLVKKILNKKLIGNDKISIIVNDYSHMVVRRADSACHSGEPLYLQLLHCSSSDHLPLFHPFPRFWPPIQLASVEQATLCVDAVKQQPFKI